MRLEELMNRAAQYDESLARDIKDYVHGRRYGLVYEASKPEFVRMWEKPVVRGDLVNILPPRGAAEDTKSEDSPSEIVYRVIGIADGTATLRDDKTCETVAAPVDDVVALARFDKPIYAGLKELGRVERGGDKPYHVVINGENYHALQALVYAYPGQVDCIYIDPPYNTGATDWKYNNRYVGKDDQYRHSKWLTFMEDRLRIAKKLLNPSDSVLIVTIDEKEYLRLGLLLEQVFPEARIQMVSSIISNNGNARASQFSRTNEYLYFVMLGDCGPEKLTLDPQWLGNLKVESSKETEGFQWGRMLRGGNSGRRAYSPGCFYPVYFDRDGVYQGIGDPLPPEKDYRTEKAPNDWIAVWPIHLDGSEGCWSCQPSLFKQLHEKGYIRFGSKVTARGVRITYIQAGMRKRIENGEIRIIGREKKNGTVILDTDASDAKYIPGTQWSISPHDATYFGTKLIANIIGRQKFTFPKSLYAVHDALRFFVARKPNALIVDFFAGSGTTLHAVNLLNAEDHGQRTCILVTNNEVSAEEEARMTEKGLRPTDAKWEKLGIARHVTWPRTVCAIEGRDVKGNPLKGDYGCPVEAYREYEGEVYDPETGTKKRKKLFEKVKKPFYPELAEHKMSDGFEENAVFFELEYLEPSVVSADLAFDRIAPLLWLAGGCRGEILPRRKGYAIGQTYAVLFDPRYKTRFVEAVSENKAIRTVFVVADAAERYRSLCAELPGRRVMQLYESYLRSFEINAMG